MTRLRQLEKRFVRNQSFFSDYKNFINDMVTKAYTRESFSQPVAAGRSWYIPRHGVYHTAKPEKKGWSSTAAQNMGKRHLIKN